MQGESLNAGQVVIGNTSDHETAMRYIDGQKRRYAPLPPQCRAAVPGAAEPEPDAKPQPEPERSCAELVATREQDLLINDWMATITSQYIYKLLHRQPITSFVSYVGTDGMSVRSVPICHDDELLPYLQVEV